MSRKSYPVVVAVVAIFAGLAIPFADAAGADELPYMVSVLNPCGAPYPPIFRRTPTGIMVCRITWRLLVSICEMVSAREREPLIYCFVLTIR